MTSFPKIRVLLFCVLATASCASLGTKTWLAEPRRFDNIAEDGHPQAAFQHREWTFLGGLRATGDLVDIEFMGNTPREISMVRPAPSDAPVNERLADFGLGALGKVRGLACRVGSAPIPNLLARAGLPTCEVVYAVGGRRSDLSASVKEGRLDRLLMSRSSNWHWKNEKSPLLDWFDYPPKAMRNGLILLPWSEVLDGIAGTAPDLLPELIAGLGLDALAGPARAQLDAAVARANEPLGAVRAAIDDRLGRIERSWNQTDLAGRLDLFSKLIEAVRAARIPAPHVWKQALPLVDQRITPLVAELSRGADAAAAKGLIATAHTYRVLARALGGAPSGDESAFARAFQNVYVPVQVTPDSDPEAGKAFGTGGGAAQGAGTTVLSLSIGPLRDTVRERIEQTTRSAKWSVTEMEPRLEHARWAGRKAAIEEGVAACYQRSENFTVDGERPMGVSDTWRQEQVMHFQVQCLEERKRLLAMIGPEPQLFSETRSSGETLVPAHVQVWEGTLSREVRLVLDGVEQKRTLSRTVSSSRVRIQAVPKIGVEGVDGWVSRSDVVKDPLAELSHELHGLVTAAREASVATRLDRHLAAANAGWSAAELDLERRAWRDALGLALTPVFGIPPTSLYLDRWPPRPARRIAQVPRCPADLVLSPDGKVCAEVTEVTVAAYDRCVKAGICRAVEPVMAACNVGRPDRMEHPVNCLAWDDADTYCRAQGRRLPTAEEWEGLLRSNGVGGRHWPWFSGNPAGRTCTSGEGKGRERTCPVGSFPSGDSGEGLKDLIGNVEELTSTTDSSRGEEMRVVEGGNYRHGAAVLRKGPGRLKTLTRDRGDYPNIGLRCVTDASSGSPFVRPSAASSRPSADRPVQVATRPTIEAVMAELGLTKATFSFPADEVDRQIRLGGKIAFEAAMRASIGALLSREGDLQQFLVAEDAPCASVKECLDRPSTLIALVPGRPSDDDRAKGIVAPDSGPTVADNWVIVVRVQELAGNPIWAVTDRKGRRPTFQCSE